MADEPPRRGKKAKLLRRPDWSRKSFGTSDVTQSSTSEYIEGPDSKTPSRTKASLGADRLPQASLQSDSVARTSTDTSRSLPRLLGGAAGIAQLLVGRIAQVLYAKADRASFTESEKETLDENGVALLDAACFDLPSVISALLIELNSLGRPTRDDHGSLVHARSQAVLFQLLASCMLHHWSDFDSKLSTHQRGERQFAFRDPPPLDESLARQLLTLCSSTLKHSDASSSRANLHTVTAAAISHAALRRAARGKDSMPLPSIPQTRQAASSDITTAAGHVIYFVSASNWSLVFARVKSRFLHHTRSDETPDAGDMRILGCCCLNRKRVSIVIQEISGMFIHIKAIARASISVSIYRAIWAWIESFPADLAELEEGRRLEGGVETLFDVIWTTSEGSKSKRFAWQTLAMLLCCCPDLIGKLVIGESRGPALSKKALFLDALATALRNKQSTAVACVADLLLASTSSDLCRPEDETEPSALRLLVADYQHDLMRCLFDVDHCCDFQDDSQQIEVAVRALMALYRLQPRLAINGGIMPCLQLDAPHPMQISAVRALSTIVSEPKPAADALLEAVGQSLRRLFCDTAPAENVTSRSVGHSSTLSGSTNDPQAERKTRRTILLSAILEVWQKDCRLLICDNAEAASTEPGAQDSLEDVLSCATDLLRGQSTRTTPNIARTLLAYYRWTEEETAPLRHRMSGTTGYDIVSALCDYATEPRRLLDDEIEAFELLDVALRNLNEMTVPLRDSDWAALQAKLEACLLLASTSGSVASRTVSKGDADEAVVQVLQASRWTGSAALRAWKECLARHKELSRLVTEAQNGDVNAKDWRERYRTPEQQLDEWIRLSRALLASGGLALSGPEAEELEDLLRTCLDLLVSETLAIREAVRNLLGCDLHPDLTALLLDQLGTILQHIHDRAEDSIEPAQTIFLESTLVVLALHVPAWQSPDTPALVTSILACLDTAASPNALHLKMRLCEWCSDGINEEDAASVINLRKASLGALAIIASAEIRPGDAAAILRRAAALLSHHGADPQACTLPVNLLASAVMADSDAGVQRLSSLMRVANKEHRTIYLQVLSLAVERGISFPRASDDPKDAPFCRLVDLLRYPGPLIVALTQVTPAHLADELIDLLLRLYATRERMSRLLRVVIEHEVTSTDHESTLFRGNTFATRLLTVHARRQGSAYLEDTLGELVTAVYNKPPDFHTDREMESAGDDAAQNLQQLTEIALLSITQSDVPPAIRDICAIIRDVVAQRFSNSVFTAIGGFLFLRFINPAIVSGLDFDLPPNTSPSQARDIRRSLVLLTKVLQSLSNNTRFNEAGLSKLSNFIDVQIFAITRFLQDVATPLVMVEPANPSVDEHALDDRDREFLHLFLSGHLQKIGVELLRRTTPSIGRKRDSGAWTWAQFTEIMAALGRPGAMSPLSTRADSMQGQDASFDHVFFQAPSTASTRRTFALILAEFPDLEPDRIALLGHILSTLRCVEGPYQVLVDATHFAKANAPSSEWISMLMGDVQLATLLRQIFIYGATPALRRYARHCSRMDMLNSLDVRLLVPLDTIEDLRLHFNDLDGLLPERSLWAVQEKTKWWPRAAWSCENDATIDFGLSQATLSIRTTRPQELFADVRATFCDSLDLDDIEAAWIELRDITIDRRNELTPLRFTVLDKSAAEELIEAIKIARNRSLPKSHVDRPISKPDSKTSTAIVICVAFEGLCSSTPSVRHTAYGLIRRLSDVPSQASPEHAHLWVPYGHTAVLAAASDNLATKYPDISLAVLEQLAKAVRTLPPDEGAALTICIRPWLHHLGSVLLAAREQRQSVQDALRLLTRNLLRTSIDSPAVSSVLKSRVWPGIGRLDFLIPTILDEAIRAVKSSAKDEPAASSVLVALSAGPALRNKLMGRARLLLDKTAAQAPPSLDQHELWPELVALIQFDLALSFDISAELCLPELFHVVVSVVGLGSSSFRQAMRALLINTVNVLASGEGVDISALRKKQHEMSNSDALFGLEDGGFDIHTAGPQLIFALTTILAAAASSEDAANAWRARWTSLATAACFQVNPCVQIRHFLVLNLGGGSGPIDGDLLFQILNALQQSLRLDAGRQDARLSLTVVIIRTLVSTLSGLDSPLLPALSWAAISLLQIGSPILSAAAIPFLSASLANMEQSGYFLEHDLADVMMDFRDDDGPESPAILLDDAVGVDFDVSFDYSLATLLFPAVREPATTASARGLLGQLAQYSRSSSTAFNQLLLSYQRPEPSPQSPHARLRIATATEDERLALLAASLGLALINDTEVYGKKASVEALIELGTLCREFAGVAALLSESITMTLEDILDDLDTPSLAHVHDIISVLPPSSPGAETAIDRLDAMGFGALASHIVHSPLPRPASPTIVTQDQAEISALASNLLGHVLTRPR